MAQNILFNGVVYSIPAVGDDSWGQSLSDFFIAIPQGAFQKSGGVFTLTADANFGANYGLLARYFATRGTLPALTGLIRLNLTDTIAWRNNANNADLPLAVNGSDQLTFNGSVLQAAGNYITALTGDVTATGPGSAASLISSHAVTADKFRQSAALSIIGNATNAIADVTDIVALTDKFVLYRNGTSLVFALLTDANIDPAAAIAYSKLALTGSILNADISGSAGIAYSKLSLTGAILNADLAGSIAFTKLAALSSGNILVGNASNVATSVPLTGDVSLTNAGVTSVAASVVTGKAITGFSSGAGTVSGSDTILSAINKLDGNIAGKQASGNYITALTGDVTASGPGSVASTIGANKVTDAMLAQMATASFKGRATAGTGNVEVLSGAAATALLSPFVGDSGAGGTKGLVPAPASGDGAATKVLRADGTWGAAGTASPLTTKGDIYSYSSTNVRHAVPADYGSIIPDSGATDGWRNAPYTQTQGRPYKNYIQYADFENNSTTGWTATGVATVTNGLPVTVGSGGAAFSSSNGGRTKNANTNAPAIDSSSAIAGTYALNLATTGAGAIGDGYISSAYTIDKADQAKVLSYKFYYKVAAGTPALAGDATNTYAVAIYDIVNNAWIIPTGAFNIIQSTGVGIAQGTFQTASNTTGIQIFIYSPVAPTGTSSLLIDDVYVGPQSIAYGPSVSDWNNNYSFTYNGLGTISNSNIYSRRVGDSLHVSGSIQLGTVSASTAYIVLPAGLTLDPAKVGTSAGMYLVGDWVIGLGASTAIPTTKVFGKIGFDGVITNQLFFHYSVGGGVPEKVNGSTIFVSSDYLTYNFIIPIAGWSSNTVNSADFDNRVCVAKYGASTQTITTTPSPIISPTVAIDTHAAYSTSTGLFTCPISGIYRVGAGFYTTGAASGTTNNAVYVAAYKNGSVVNQFIVDAADASAVLNYTGYGSVLVQANAGDTLGAYISKDSGVATVSLQTASYNWVSFERISGSAVTPVIYTPTIQKFTSGSGTYTTPAGTKYIRVKMVGGGGGGSASGTNTPGTAATAGTATTFGSSLLSAGGGGAGTYGTPVGAGGTSSLGTGPIGIALTGASGAGSGTIAASGTANMAGGSGGSSALGGGGGGGHASLVGGAGVANTGGGGGGAGTGLTGNNQGGCGGGAGGYIEAIISSPSLTYAYTVGSGGSGGASPTSGANGGAGGSGLIEVTEYYQ